MIPVDQDVFGEEKGNCWSACIASILELKLKEVPNFCGGQDHNFKPCSPDDWAKETGIWLEKRGYVGAFFLAPDIYRPDSFHILSGKSPRGEWEHAVVALGNALVHDPHFSKNYLDCMPKDAKDSFLIFHRDVVSYKVSELQEKIKNDKMRTACIDRRLTEVAEWITDAVNLDHVRAEALEKEAAEVACMSGSLWGRCVGEEDFQPCDCCMAAARMLGRAKALRGKS